MIDRMSHNNNAMQKCSKSARSNDGCRSKGTGVKSWLSCFTCVVSYGRGPLGRSQLMEALLRKASRFAIVVIPKGVFYSRFLRLLSSSLHPTNSGYLRHTYILRTYLPGHLHHGARQQIANILRDLRYSHCHSCNLVRLVHC